MFLGNEAFVQRMPAPARKAQEVSRRQQKVQDRSVAQLMQDRPSREQALCIAYTEAGYTMTRLAQDLGGIGFSNALFSPRTPPETPPAELSDTHPRGCWARHQPVEH